MTGLSQATSSDAAIKAVRGATQSRYFDKIPLLYSRSMAQGQGGTNEVGGTSRLLFQAPMAMHDPQVVFMNYVAQATPEGTGSTPNPITISGAFEYPAGTLYPLTFSGKATAVIAPGGKLKSDDVAALELPLGAQAWVRTYVQIALPPLLPAATAGTGGSLAAGTYYYRVTTLSGEQGESGPSTEASATVTASGSVALSWSLNPLSTASTGMRIYRGTSSGNEVLLATLPGWTSNWIDTGVSTPGAATPPAAQTYVQGCAALGNVGGTALRPGEGSNYVFVAGNGSNQLANGNATSWMSSQNAFVYGPSAVIAIPDTGYDVPVVGIFGDSIMYGQGDYNDRGYMAYAMLQNNTPYFYAPRQGECASNAVTNAQAQRLLMAQGCSDAVCNYGTNDIYVNGNALATVQGNLIAYWQRLRRRSLRVWQTTIGVRVVSSDNLATIANQYRMGGVVGGATNASPIVINQQHYMADGTPVKVGGVGGNTAANGNWYAKATGYDPYHFALYQDAALTIPVSGNGAYTGGGYFDRMMLETTRTGLNDWLRAGAPVASALNPSAVAIGTSGALLAGHSGHPLTGVIDTAAAVEVNAANVPANDGGYWMVNGTANYLCSDGGTHPNPAGVALLAARINPALFTTP